VKGNGRAKCNQNDAVSQGKCADAAAARECPEGLDGLAGECRPLMLDATGGGGIWPPPPDCSVSLRCNPISAAGRVQEQPRSHRHPFCPVRPWHLRRPSSRLRRSSRLRLFLQARLSLLVVRQVQVRPRRPQGPKAQPPSVGHMRSMPARTVLLQLPLNIS